MKNHLRRDSGTNRARNSLLLCTLLCLTFLSPFSFSPAGAEETAADLRRALRELERQRIEQEKQIRALEERLKALEERQRIDAAREKQRALDQAVEQSSAPRESVGTIYAGPGGTRLRLIDLSFDVMTAAGWSTASDADLGGRLQAGGHDPRRRGFTLQQGELSLAGAVDPYLRGEAHILFTSDVVELEEAFMTTTSLPYGLEAKAGYMLTEYGLLNPLHPHAWDWIDQPVVLSRFMGPEGLRATGARLSWLTPLPWYSEVLFGVQNAREGETTASFVSGEPVGGRPAVARPTRGLKDLLYLARWEQFWDLSEETGFKLGANLLHGPNSTGNDGETWIYGVDWKLRWRPANNFRGWPFFLWQTEIHKRDYTASYYVPGAGAPPPSDDHGHSHGHSHGGGEETSQTLPEEPLAGTILRDVGFYTQGLYGFRYGWAGGLRLEYASGKGASLDGRQNDPLRDDRWRVSPLLVWHPTEYSRFRLQYNYDRARFLSERDAHSVWVGAEILYGAHPAHKY
jgi:hypothetical protein